MRWLTYFPVVENVHLTKDVGLMPWYAGRMGFEACLAGHFPQDDYPALKGEVSGLKTHKLGKIQKKSGPRTLPGFLDREFVRLLRRDGKSIDVLHLFHLGRDTIAYGAIYKTVNPNGKLYIKLDAYNNHLTQRKRYSKAPWKNNAFRTLERYLFSRVDLLSVENRKGLALAKETYPKWADRLVYLPNGANDQYLRSRFGNAKIEKEKIMLSVGRPGSSDKNYALLLRALPLMRREGWRTVVVGPCTEAFREDCATLFLHQPKLREKIDFVGAVSNRDTLYDLYRRATVFFLPSKQESFGISYAEALYFGCALVGHKGMSAYDDLCGQGAYGTYYTNDDEVDFARALERAANMSQSEGFTAFAAAFASRNFHWSTLMEGLFETLDLRKKLPMDDGGVYENLAKG